jgi:hypothetical protein
VQYVVLQPVTWPRTCELSLTAWWPVGVRWGGTPAETAAEAEVLITILPGGQELHDGMIIPRSTRGTTLSGVVISAPRCG